jgi:uncharacterized protein
MTTTRRKLADIGRPLFDAAAEGRLVIPQCSSCGRHFFYPTVLCPHCHSKEWLWVESAGTGAVYSFTVVHRPLSSRLPAPYIIVIVGLDEGIRMMGNLLNCGIDDVAIGDRVRVTFAPGVDERVVPMFTPDTASGMGTASA